MVGVTHGECHRKGLGWLELVRVMVRDVTRHRRTKNMRPVRMANLVQVGLGIVTQG